MKKFNLSVCIELVLVIPYIDMALAMPSYLTRPCYNMYSYVCVYMCLCVSLCVFMCVRACLCMCVTFSLLWT